MKKIICKQFAVHEENTSVVWSYTLSTTQKVVLQFNGLAYQRPSGV